MAGRRPVEEAFAARREARRLLVVPERRAALDQIVLHATTLRIPVVEVEGGTITAVSGFDGHQGVALVVAPRHWASLDEVLALARSRGEPPFVLVLDHFEDPQNLGTLLRTAEACGVHGALFPTKGSAPFSPAAIKASAGAIEHLLLVPLADLAAGLVDLHTRGLRIVAADGDAPMIVREADLRGPLAVVIGSEGRGLQSRIRRRVDVMARIPMYGRVASLNASVAGSVFLYEAATQRADAARSTGRGVRTADVDRGGDEDPESSGPMSRDVAQAQEPPGLDHAADDRAAAEAPPRDDSLPDPQSGGSDDDLLPEA